MRRRTWLASLVAGFVAVGLPVGCASLSGLSSGTDDAGTHDAHAPDATTPSGDGGPDAPAPDATSPSGDGGHDEMSADVTDAPADRTHADATDATDATEDHMHVTDAPSDGGRIVAIAVSAGGKQACAIIAGGTVRCWGSDNFAQLGDGQELEAGVSKPIVVDAAVGATHISVGYYHACAIVGDAGSVLCWGGDTDGELGNGEIAPYSLPVSVVGVKGATAIAAGDDFSCAIVGDAGSVMCWGLAADGQLGNDETMANETTPVSVPGIAGATGIATGYYHTCVLVAGGVQCFGSNGYGQLGHVTADAAANLVPRAVPGLTGVIAITAGGYHTCAILGDGGAVECWGDNAYGQLGNDASTMSSVPVKVTLDASAVAIGAGEYHSCAILAGGHVMCWGYDLEGQLGSGAMLTTSPKPLTAVGLQAAVRDAGAQKSLALGATVTCALTSDGGVDCWGDNTYGEVGNGTTTGKVYAPAPVVW